MFRSRALALRVWTLPSRAWTLGTGVRTRVYRPRTLASGARDVVSRARTLASSESTLESRARSCAIARPFRGYPGNAGGAAACCSAALSWSAARWCGPSMLLDLSSSRTSWPERRITTTR